MNVCLIMSLVFSMNRPVPELSLEIPQNAETMKSGWRSNPLRMTKTFRWGYFKWCDDPDCPQCADVVYKYDPLYDSRPTVPIKR